MSRTIYALLAGIDQYPQGVRPLAGCVNDIRHITELLRERISDANDLFEPLILTDAEATRQAIIDGFRHHLRQGGRDDVVLFYFSGHGSQQPSPKEFWHLEPDHLDETLVCYDSRSSSWDLADKELAQLIAEVAENGPHIVVILDCCHSGSGTRNFDIAKEGVLIRRAPTDDRLRPLESFIVSSEQASAFPPPATTRGGGHGGWYTLPTGRHIVLSACSDEEEAKELRLGTEQRGIFSYYLLDTLQSIGNSLSYRDLFKRVNAQVRLHVSAQSPQMEASQTIDLEQSFLGGAIQPGTPYFTASYDKKRHWVIDAGSLHGIPALDGDETTWLSLFPVDRVADSLNSLSAAIGTARVTEVYPGQSKVNIEMIEGMTVDMGITYKAVVTALPLRPTIVAIEGEENGVAMLRGALATNGPEGKPSLLVREGGLQDAELYVQAANDRFRIRRKGDIYSLIVDTEGFTDNGVQLAVQRLEQIARWLLIGGLSNPTSAIATGAVQMEIQVPDASGKFQPSPDGSHLKLAYQLKGDEWHQPQFKIKFTNTTNKQLYCILLDLPETYGVYPVLPGGGFWLGPKEEAWVNNGEPLFGEVLDSLWENGVVEFKDTLKLIISTEESDATLLEQPDLQVVMRGDPLRPFPMPTHSLNRLMARVSTRHLTIQPSNSEKRADWATVEVSITIVRPLEAAKVPPPTETVTLGHDVTLHGHATIVGRNTLHLSRGSRCNG